LCRSAGRSKKISGLRQAPTVSSNCEKLDNNENNIYARAFDNLDIFKLSNARKRNNFSSTFIIVKEYQVWHLKKYILF